MGKIFEGWGLNATKNRGCVLKPKEAANTRPASLRFEDCNFANRIYFFNIKLCFFVKIDGLLIPPRFYCNRDWANCASIFI